MNLFNMEWDSRIDQYGKQVEELSSELAKKHEEQLVHFFVLRNK